MDPIKILDGEMTSDQANLKLGSDGLSYIVKAVASPGAANRDAVAVLSGHDKPLVSQRDHSPVGGCAWATDGSLFAVGNWPGRLHPYRTGTPTESTVLRLHRFFERRNKVSHL